MLLGCSVYCDVWLILLYMNIILSIYLYQIKCWTNICRSVCVYKYNLIIINTVYNQIKCWINIYCIQMNEISIKPIFLKCITPACPIVMRSHGTQYLLILTADSWSNNCCQKGSQVYSDGVMVCEEQSKILSNFCIDCGQNLKKTNITSGKQTGSYRCLFILCISFTF